MSNALTHIETEKQLIPALRFAGDTESWKEKKIGAFANVRSGYTFSRDYQGLKNEKWLYLKVADIGIKSNIKYLKKAINTISEETLNKMKAKPFRKGCTVFPRVGAALLNNNKRLLFVDSLVDDNVLALNIFDVEKCDDEFIFYWFLTKHLSDFCNNGQIPVISATRVKSFYVPIPGKIEQQKIASFLSAVDEKIQQLTKKKALLEQYKKGVMQQLFRSAGSGQASGQLRFKDENGNSYPDWEKKRLKDVLYEHKTKNKDGSVTEVFSVAKKKGIVNQIEHLGRSFAAATTLHYKVAFPGDLIYTKSPTKDFPFGIIKQNLTGRKGLVSPLYVVTTPQTDSLGFMFHCYFLSWVNVYNYLVPLVQKGAKNTMNINNDEFLNGAKFTLPISEKEQQKIATYLSRIDTKIEAVSNQITQTQTFKKGLLQQMFV